MARGSYPGSVSCSLCLEVQMPGFSHPPRATPSPSPSSSSRQAPLAKPGVGRGVGWEEEWNGPEEAGSGV